MYTHTHICMHIYIYICLYTCMYICICICICICIRIYIYIYVCVHVYVYVHVYVHVHIVWFSVICFNLELRSAAIFASSLVFFVFLTRRERHDIDIRRHLQALLYFPVICFKLKGRESAREVLSGMFTIRSPAERVHTARF